MKNGLILIMILVFGKYVSAQQTDCKVTIAEINESYSGDCKNGLAHGKGIARGIDYYEGQFIKGMPDGKGTYRWASGIYYEGQWKQGMKEGIGKMVYKDSVTTGYWKADNYFGEKYIPPYSITRSRSVARSSISKTIGTLNEVRIRILQGGTVIKFIENFSMYSSSGTEYNTGDFNGFGIQNTLFPLDVKIKYTSWNKMHTDQYEVIFEFTINDPGSWEVIINN
jgi:hypothetical protein